MREVAISAEAQHRGGDGRGIVCPNKEVLRALAEMQAQVGELQSQMFGLIRYIEEDKEEGMKRCGVEGRGQGSKRCGSLNYIGVGWGGLGPSVRPVGGVFKGKGVGLLEGPDMEEGLNRVRKPKSQNDIGVSGGLHTTTPTHTTEPPPTQKVSPALGESFGGTSEPMPHRRKKKKKIVIR